MPATSAPPAAPTRGALRVALVCAGAVVVALTLTPQGTGWAWAPPVSEARWYATGLDSAPTLLQLLGNLGLLVVPAALAVLLWPSLRSPIRLAGAALAAGGSIELLQWALSVGRVISPLDAALNATGAVVAGLLVAATRSAGHPVSERSRTSG
ncbi:VanZ family protein [Blastococcus sp. SYSU D01042]